MAISRYFTGHYLGDHIMQRSYLVALTLPLALSGCLSFSSSNPAPPAKTTVVVPQSNATMVCNPAPCLRSAS
ncbi:MAG: hypothetical protein ABSF50_11045 [Burkholderiaceae bacterium]